MPRHPRTPSPRAPNPGAPLPRRRSWPRHASACKAASQPPTRRARRLRPARRRHSRAPIIRTEAARHARSPHRESRSVRRPQDGRRRRLLRHPSITRNQQPRGLNRHPRRRPPIQNPSPRLGQKPPSGRILSLSRSRHHQTLPPAEDGATARRLLQAAHRHLRPRLQCPSANAPLHRARSSAPGR